MKKIVCLTWLALLLMPLPMMAATIYINANTGDDATGDGSSGNPYQTFDKGYTMAVNGDILDLTGTFDWSVQSTNIASPTGYTIAKNLTIQGQGMDQTFIQAQSSKGTSIERMVFYFSGSTLTLENLTIRYGYLQTTNSSYYGAGITHAGSGTLTINNCSIVDNVHASSQGSLGMAGGIGMQGGTLVMDKCVVARNERRNNQYYGAGGVATGQSADLTITNSTFDSNLAYTASPLTGGGYTRPAGGLAMFRFCDLVMTNCTFVGNTTSSSGGGYEPILF
ncbi:MAG: hypothetical protein D6722_05660 [Bacteroidetes bacterium]|nr:MAG: hypothetical protein D6722_05660 [Bacteroidota bacterium]